MLTSHESVGLFTYATRFLTISKIDVSIVFAAACNLASAQIIQVHL